MNLHPTTEMLTLVDLASEARISLGTVESWVYGSKTAEPCLASFNKGSVRLVSRENWTRFVLLNTLNPRRPDWLTAAVESEFRRQLRDVVAAEIRSQMAEGRGLTAERIAA